MENAPITGRSLAPAENHARENPVLENPTEIPSAAATQPEQPEQPIKRKRGRPPKPIDPNAPPKRPRGRPRKHPKYQKPEPPVDLPAFIEEHRDHVVVSVERAADPASATPTAAMQPEQHKRKRGRPSKMPGGTAPVRPSPGRPSNEELAAAWAAPKSSEGHVVERNADGTIKKGQVLNPGGLTTAQARIKNMLEGATVPLITRLLELAQSQDEQIALGAVRAWLDKVAVAPKTANVAVAVQVKSTEGHMSALRAMAERRATIEALPAPAGHEVTVSVATADGVSHTHVSTDGRPEVEHEVIDVEAEVVET